MPTRAKPFQELQFAWGQAVGELELCMVLLRYELATIAIPKALSVTNSSAVPSPFRSHPVIMKSLADIWQGVQAVRGAFPAGSVYELNPKCRFLPTW